MNKLSFTQILRHPNRWCQGVQYRGEDGSPCDAQLAYSCCLYGAARLAIPGREEDLNHLLPERRSSIGGWNDASNWSEVRAFAEEMDERYHLPIYPEVKETPPPLCQILDLEEDPDGEAERYCDKYDYDKDPWHPPA